MKARTTQKYIRTVYGSSVFSVGYCGAWHLLNGTSPFAYNSGIYGWNCDYYNFGGVIICTGYRPHGRSCYDITAKFENIATEIYNNRDLSWEERGAKIAAVRADWIAELDKQ